MSDDLVGLIPIPIGLVKIIPSITTPDSQIPHPIPVLSPVALLGCSYTTTKSNTTISVPNGTQLYLQIGVQPGNPNSINWNYQITAPPGMGLPTNPTTAQNLLPITLIQGPQTITVTYSDSLSNYQGVIIVQPV